MNPFSSSPTAGTFSLAAQATSLDLVEGSHPPVYRINNTLPIALDFGDLVAILSEAAASRPGSGRDARFVDIGVADMEMVRMGITALSQEQYGSLNIQLFGDLDSALAYARERQA